MDPQKPSKHYDGNLDFPECVSFPVDVTVMIKFFKVNVCENCCSCVDLGYL